MKKSLLMVLAVLMLASFAPEAQAQGILGKLKDKVKEKVDQTVNDAINGSSSDKKNKKSDKTEKESTKEADQTTVSNEKSDFVPGSIVLFEDNFANEKIGEFPSKWDLIDGAIETANIGGRKVPQWTEGGTIMPLMKKNEFSYLPEEFTIEWDVYISKQNDDWDELNHEIGLMTREEDVNSWNHYAGYVTIWYRPSDGASYIVWHCQKPTDGTVENEVRDSKTNIKAGAWNHFAISFNKRAFKLYVNGVRICNVPSMLQPRYIQYQANSEYPFSAISNMRIAQGAVELYDRNAGDIDKAISESGKFVTNNILFATGKADLKPESMTEIQKIADYMKKNPSVRFEVQGHTDNQGSDAVNDPLSQKRAEAIVKALEGLGVDGFNLKAVGKGSHEPVADNSTEAGRAKNRRVEFISNHPINYR